MKFLLEQASDYAREEIVEISSLEQLLELIVKEDCYGPRQPAVVVEKLGYPVRPDIQWGIIIYDSHLE